MGPVRGTLAVLIALFPPVAAATLDTWQIINRVEIEHGPLTIDHSKSVAEITAAQAKGGFPAEHGLGLFQNRVKTELVIEPGKFQARRLDLTTRIKTAPIIYIAREFPKGSCAWDVVHSHELLHQLYDLEVLRALPDEIQGITRAAFATDELDWSRPVNLERARNRFFQLYKFVYDALSRPRHQTIDSPESYRRLSQQCNGEISRSLAAGKP
jgi:hypothetical protein